MGERVEFDGTHIRVLDGDDVVIWSDEQRPINLLPAAFTINATVDLQFPDMVGKSFVHHSSFTTSSGGATLVGCSCYATYEPSHEWGPAEAAPYNLPEQVLGSVPSGVNFLDVRVHLTRTTAPGNYLSVAIRNELPEEETFLPGGSMSLEEAPAWMRAAWIGLDGTSVVARRWQSVRDAGTPVPAANNPGTGYGVFRPEVGNRRFGALQSSLPVSGASPACYYNTGQCPPGTLPNWSARWQGTAVIRPGYVALS